MRGIPVEPEERFRRYVGWSVVLHLAVIVLLGMRWLPEPEFVEPSGIPVEMVSPDSLRSLDEEQPAAREEQESPAEPTPEPPAAEEEQPVPPKNTQPPKATPPPPEPTPEPKQQVPDQAKRRNTPKPTPPPRKESNFEETREQVQENPLPDNPAVVPREQREVFETDSKGTKQGGSVAFEQNFQFDYYLAAMVTKVRRRWNPIPGYMAEGAELVTVIYFRLDRSGNLLEARIEESCGKPRLDRQALRAVQSAAPFAELPPRYDYDELGIHFAFYLYK